MGRRRSLCGVLVTLGFRRRRRRRLGLVARATSFLGRRRRHGWFGYTLFFSTFAFEQAFELVASPPRGVLTGGWKRERGDSRRRGTAEWKTRKGPSKALLGLALARQTVSSSHKVQQKQKQRRRRWRQGTKVGGENHTLGNWEFVEAAAAYCETHCAELGWWANDFRVGPGLVCRQPGTPAPSQRPPRGELAECSS